MHNVRVRIVPPATAFILCLGCGLLEDPEEGNRPPINESVNGSPGGGFLPGDTDTDTDTTGGSDSGTTAGATSGADSTGTGPDLGMGVLFVGTIGDGGGAWTPPFDCEVRLYSEDQLDPMTGAADDSVAQYPIELVNFPHAFMVTRNDVPADVDFGWEGYIGVRCDPFGDDSYTVGAFHPSLPAQIVTLPVDMVTLDLQFL